MDVASSHIGATIWTPAGGPKRSANRRIVARNCCDKLSKWAKFKPETSLIKEGDHGDSFFILAVAGSVVLVYSLILRYFTIEVVVRPELEEIAKGLPPDFEIDASGLPLRWRILAIGPAINVITGVVVAGLAGHHQHAGLRGLGAQAVVRTDLEAGMDQINHIGPVAQMIDEAPEHRGLKFCSGFVVNAHARSKTDPKTHGPLLAFTLALSLLTRPLGTLESRQ